MLHTTKLPQLPNNTQTKGTKASQSIALLHKRKKEKKRSFYIKFLIEILVYFFKNLRVGTIRKQVRCFIVRV